MATSAASEATFPVIIGSVIATGAVLLGLGDWPYGYYILLRLFLCGMSLFLLAGASLALTDWQKWALGGFTVLYNPVLPIRLGEKEIWAVLNLATVVLFWVVSFRRGSEQPPSASHNSESKNIQPSMDDHVEREARIREARRGREEANERLERWQDRAYRK